MTEVYLGPKYRDEAVEDGGEARYSDRYVQWLEDRLAEARGRGRKEAAIGRHVYQLRARLLDPLTESGYLERHSSTVFPTIEAAKSRFAKFAAMIRDDFKVGPDYPVSVWWVAMEVINA